MSERQIPDDLEKRWPRCPFQRIGREIYVKSLSPFAGPEWAMRSLASETNNIKSKIERGFYEAEAAHNVTGKSPEWYNEQVRAMNSIHENRG